MGFKYEVIRRSETEVVVGSNLLTQVGSILHSVGIRNKALIISHEEINERYGGSVESSLESAGIKAVMVTIPSGETYKQWNTLARILPILQLEKLDRSCAIGSLGGGVAGDLAGYLATIYMRGVNLFHIPTTLLAQVDSALGGKTAVNFQQHKNMLGTYYQPRAIIADIDTLHSLPEREFAAGMAEVIKTALLSGEELLSICSPEALTRGPLQGMPLQTIVEKCLRFKANVVMQDELDYGSRQQLNLGHTFGHAFEAAGGFNTYNHGEAVGLGLLCALRLSQHLLGCDPSLEERTRKLLQHFNLPVTIKTTYDDIAKHLNSDKKRQEGKLRFIGLKGIGEFAVIDNPSPEAIAHALQAVQA